MSPAESRVPDALERCACPLCACTDDGIVVGTRGRFGVAVTNVVCNECGLVFVNPRPTREAMGEYYAREYRAHYAESGVAYVLDDGDTVAPGDPRFEAEVEAWHEAQANASLILGGLRQNQRVLEVGCRQGRTLAILRERHGIQAYGIEPGVEEAAKATAAGIECFAGVLEEFDPGDRRFDVVQLFHVLEHLHDPLDALLRFRPWLVPSGRLLVEVPNVYQPYGSLEGNFFQNAHLTSLSADTLAALFGRAGYRVAHVHDGQTLFMVATVDPASEDVPREFRRRDWLDPSHDAEWVAARLVSYGELHTLALRIRAGEVSFETLGRAATLLSGPCFPHFGLDTLAQLVDALVPLGAFHAALLLARAFTLGPEADEAREAAAELGRELALLVAEHERAQSEATTTR